MGIDGCIFPGAATPVRQAARKNEMPAFGEFLDDWYLIQVKQKDKAGQT